LSGDGDATVVSLSPPPQETAKQNQASKSQKSGPQQTSVDETTKDGAPRVSVCPDLTRKGPPLPVFKGTALEKMESCLHALHPSYQTERPTIVRDKHSSFANNMNKVSGFVQAALSSECFHGEEEGKPAALYCCGAPGIGKTSGVTWCCEQAVQCLETDDVTAKPVLCSINASGKTWKTILNTIGSSLGLKSKLTEKNIETKLRKSATPILVVVDEIDTLLSGGHGSSKYDGLVKLLKWAGDDSIRLALIGISNAMNDEISHELRVAGEVRSESDAVDFRFLYSILY